MLIVIYKITFNNKITHLFLKSNRRLFLTLVKISVFGIFHPFKVARTCVLHQQI